MPYFYDIYYFILVIPALILSFYAQYKVSHTFSKYSAVQNKKAATGEQVARKILNMNGLNNVSVNPVNGNLTDHYNPANNTVNLSESVHSSTSVAALGVAAHEVGHALQYADKYAPISVRNKILPVARISSTAAPYLALFGFIFGFEILVNIGIILFSAVVLFQLVTLPVEFNASRRALTMLDQYGILAEDEIAITKKVLSAAAMTYLASAIMGIANLLRLVLLARNRRR